MRHIFSELYEITNTRRETHLVVLTGVNTPVAGDNKRQLLTAEPYVRRIIRLPYVLIIALEFLPTRVAYREFGFSGVAPFFYLAVLTVENANDAAVDCFRMLNRARDSMRSEELHLAKLFG